MQFSIAIEEIAPSAYAALAEKENDHVLLDVREQMELDICKIPGSVHIPMGEIAERLNEIPSEKLVVVYCHHGRRSMMVANVLQQNGFKNLLNMQGGIDLYAEQCDASMSRY